MLKKIGEFMTKNLGEQVRQRLLRVVANRTIPTELTQRDDEFYSDKDNVEYFRSLVGKDLGPDALFHATYALGWFSKEAFCYYFPSILAEIIQTDFTHRTVLDSIIYGLNGAHSAVWKQFFASYSSEEKAAIIDWFTALRDSSADYDREMIRKAVETLESG